MIQVIPPSGPLRVNINLPLSKSIANRQLCIRYLSGNKDEYLIPGCSDSLLMRDLLNHLQTDGATGVFDCADAGTVFRFLTAILANSEGDRLITGSERMQQRPCAPLVNALNELGAGVAYQFQSGYPPLVIKGKRLRGGSIAVEASVSSQFISALMMIGATMYEGLNIVLKGDIVSKPYIEMTAWLMREQGIEVELNEREIRILPGQYQFKSSLYEADWSAASYWYAAAAMASEAEICLKGLKRGSAQGDSRLATMFEALGVESNWQGDDLLLLKNGNTVDGFEAVFTDCPDLFPAVAITCAGLGITCRFSGLSTLKDKESNRLNAVGNELQKLGYRVRQDNNLFEILPGRSDNHNTRIKTYNDHRIAMSFAMLSIIAGELVIIQPSVVVKSYPDFWNHLIQAGFSLVSLRENSL